MGAHLIEIQLPILIPQKLAPATHAAHMDRIRVWCSSVSSTDIVDHHIISSEHCFLHGELANKMPICCCKGRHLHLHLIRVPRWGFIKCIVVTLMQIPEMIYIRKCGFGIFTIAIKRKEFFSISLLLIHLSYTAPVWFPKPVFSTVAAAALALHSGVIWLISFILFPPQSICGLHNILSGGYWLLHPLACPPGSSHAA